MTKLSCYRDMQCGMLHCTHLNERLEFGMESVAILSHSFINSQGSIIPCRSVIVDLGLNEVDPGLSPDGARCGEGKVCSCSDNLDLSSLPLKFSGVSNYNGLLLRDGRKWVFNFWVGFFFLHVFHPRKYQRKSQLYLY